MNRVAWLLTLWMTLAGMAQANDRPVVIELFTSQGCSSCPPADELLAKLGTRDDVIALALHVDYWDYIGWKDSFASPEYTRRQKAYARSLDNRMVYTPQMIIDGEKDVVGNRPMDVADAIQAQRSKKSTVALDVTRQGGNLIIEATPQASVGPADIFLVRYKPEATVDIRRGENAGKRITYSNIVSDWSRLTDWNGRGPLKLTAQISGNDPVVVLVQSASLGPILAAVRLR